MVKYKPSFSHYHLLKCLQTTVMGRGVKLGGSGGIVTIQDIATGIIVSGYGETQEVCVEETINS